MQNRSMSSKRTAPVPPVRYSSKRTPILKCVSSKNQSHSENNKSNRNSEVSKSCDSRSVDLYDFRTCIFENVGRSNVLQHYKQVYSSDNRPNFVREDFSDFRTNSPCEVHSSNIKMTDRNFTSYVGLNSPAASVSRQRFCPHKCTAGIDNSKHSSSYFHDSSSDYNAAAEPNQLYAQCAVHQMPQIEKYSHSSPYRQVEHLSSSLIQSGNSNHQCVDYLNEKENSKNPFTETNGKSSVDKIYDEEWIPETCSFIKQTEEFPDMVQERNRTAVNENGYLSHLYIGEHSTSCSGIDDEFCLPKSIRRDSVEQTVKRSYLESSTIQNNLSNSLNRDNNKENIKHNNCPREFQSNSITKALNRLGDAAKNTISPENNYNFKHCYDSDHFIKSVCFPERKDISIKNNFKDFEVHYKGSLNKIQTRMITILPSVVHVSKLTIENLEPRLAHSEPQIIRKQFCKIDLNPLRLYLKRYGQNISEHNVKSFIPGPDLNGSRKLSCMTKSNVDMCFNGLLLKKPNYFFEEPENILSRLENLTSFTANLTVQNSKATCDISLPPTKFTRATFKDQINIQNNNFNTLKDHTTIGRNRKNIFMDKSNVVLYHQYISTMVHSIAKSRKFLLLKRFYSGLESNNNLLLGHSGEFSTIRIKQFDVAWGKLSNYRKWERHQDQSLKIRHSSVEDLRQLFQSKESNAKKINTANRSSFEYRKLWYNVSVSNLIQKYSSMQNIQENLEVRLDTEIYYGSRANNEVSKLSEISNISEPTLRFSFLRCPINSFIERHISTSYSKLSDSIRTPTTSFVTSVSSSNSDIHSSCSSHIRRKVKFFEDISQDKKWKETFPTYHCSSDDLKVGKFSHCRNLSWSDLRNLDKCFSRENNSVFSPQYLPEKAVSCLDLSVVSECSRTVAESSFLRSDREWASSSNSCFSQDNTEKRNGFHIRSIKTGTVSKIKRKLEQATSLSRSQSVPHSITSSGINSQNKIFTYDERPLMASNVSPGSVQNLKHLFESEGSGMSTRYVCKYPASRINSLKIRKLEDSYCCRSEMDLKVLSKVDNNKGRSLNICCKDASRERDSHKSALEHYMKKRFQNLITKFEKGSSHDVTEKEFSDFKRPFCYETKVTQGFCQSSFNENMVTTTAVTELSLSFNGKNSTTYSRMTNVHSHSLHHQGHVNGAQKNTDNCTKAWNSGNWMKSYFPKVRNNFPKPYVKQENSICRPVKICLPGLYK